MTTLFQDLRYGLRMLAKNPGFTAVAVIALAVGIAVNTAVFTAYNATRQPIQAADPSRLVNIYRSSLQDHYAGSFSYPDYAYFRDHSTVFSSLIAASGDELALSDAGSTHRAGVPAGGGITGLIGIRFFQQVGGTAELVRAAMVSDNYFSGLGISPFMGRVFTPEEGRPRSKPRNPTCLRF